MVEAGELELIKIRYNFKTHFGSSWFEAMEALTAVTKLIEASRFLSHFISYVGRAYQNQVFKTHFRTFDSQSTAQNCLRDRLTRSVMCNSLKVYTP